MAQRQAAIRMIVAAVCVAMTLVLGGVALMLWVSTGAVHWLLWAVPLAPLGIAALAIGWPLAMVAQVGFAASVKKQIDEDLQLFKEIL